MLNVAIVDDEKDVCAELSQMVARYASENGQPIAVARIEDPRQIIETARADANAYDIVLLDIEMPQMDGLECAHALRNLGVEAQIVFVTNMAQMAIRGYEVGALDFVVKPVSYPTFAFKFQRIVQAAQRRQKRIVLLETKDGLVRLDASEVFYVEVNNHRLIYHTAEGRIERWDTIKNAAAQLEGHGFAFCNACYLVNLEKVRGLQGDYVRVGDDLLKMSRGKSRAFLDELTRSVGR